MSAEVTDPWAVRDSQEALRLFLTEEKRGEKMHHYFLRNKLRKLAA